VITSGPVSPAGVGLVRGLGVLAAAAIVIGDVIGTGVFLKARVMTCNVETPGMVMAVWVVAGLLSLAGALTYAELSAMMPRAGGEYVFIRQAYGSLLSFLYGWTRFFVASTGGIAGLAAGFAIFINVLTGGALQDPWFTIGFPGRPLAVSGLQGMAVAAVLVVTIVNCRAVEVGGRIAFMLTTPMRLFVSSPARTCCFWFAENRRRKAVRRVPLIQQAADAHSDTTTIGRTADRGWLPPLLRHSSNTVFVPPALDSTK
jgi:hypothetical protein